MEVVKGKDERYHYLNYYLKYYYYDLNYYLNYYDSNYDLNYLNSNEGKSKVVHDKDRNQEERRWAREKKEKEKDYGKLKR